ncbi:hypothetical protein BGZ57DRAFT_865496 [Hyaloscypha finlandica]|nr:hypothetical protein BGZ57DRAFT_865496 [Hyaloscypha finlandica]
MSDGSLIFTLFSILAIYLLIAIMWQSVMGQSKLLTSSVVRSTNLTFLLPLMFIGPTTIIASLKLRRMLSVSPSLYHTGCLRTGISIARRCIKPTVSPLNQRSWSKPAARVQSSSIRRRA